MADQAVKLSEVRKKSGAELLKMTDELSMGIVGAGWVHTIASGSWYYFLVTPMLDAKGPAWIYKRLVKVFQLRPLPEEITPLDIRIMSPNDLFFSSLPFRAEAVGALGLEMFMEVQNIQFALPDGTLSKIDHLSAYRLFPNKTFSDRSAQFDRRVRELVAA